MSLANYACSISQIKRILQNNTGNFYFLTCTYSHASTQKHIPSWYRYVPFSQRMHVCSLCIVSDRIFNLNKCDKINIKWVYPDVYNKLDYKCLLGSNFQKKKKKIHTVFIVNCVQSLYTGCGLICSCNNSGAFTVSLQPV